MDHQQVIALLMVIADQRLQIEALKQQAALLNSLPPAPPAAPEAGPETVPEPAG